MGATTYVLPQTCGHCHWYLPFPTGEGICSLWQMSVPHYESCNQWLEKQPGDEEGW